MTIPEERTRALKWAGEFLVEVLRTPECPQELREQARMILRHYPDAASIEPCPMRYGPEGDTYFHPEMSLSPDFCC